MLKSRNSACFSAGTKLSALVVSGFALFTSLKLCARYIMYINPGACSFAGSLPQCWLVSILDRAD